MALAFKLTVEPIGQLTYIRIDSGTLKRMHANKQEDIDIAIAYRKAFSRWIIEAIA
jgi:translation elongation factor EF-G